MRLCTHFRKPSEETYRKITKKKNRQMAESFAAVPYAERVVFVPHCMRNVQKCIAKDMGSHYLCMECGNCKIGPISKKGKALGYKAVFVLKGGRAVEKIVGEIRPKAVFGVACFFEGAQGMEQTAKNRLAVQFVALARDGCVNTDVELEEVLKMMEKKKG